jgi:HEAT repeat protein
MAGQDTDSDPLVLHSAAFALGHLGDARGTPALVRLAEHDDVDVRHGVAFAPGGRSDPEAIAALIRLTNDPEAFVRDWATFGLGEPGTVDTPEIQQTLHRRLDDEDEQTRYEAICGLAWCGDLRVVQPIIDGLTEEADNFSLFRPAMALLHIDSEGLTAAELIARLRALAAF